MLRKIRYGLVLFLSGAVILGTIVGTGITVKRREMKNNESVSPESTGNVVSPFLTDQNSDSDESETETESPVKNDEDKELVLFDKTEPVPGLRGYFQRKLKINPAKVELYLNVRETPSPDGKILTVLYPADLVEYLGRQGDWYYVSANGFTGFVHSTMVLTDGLAYEDMRNTVGYAVMVTNNNTYLFMDPNDDNTGVIVARKSDSYRVIGVTETSYKVTGDFTDYSYLYLLKRQSILYYMFLGPGNDNGLSEEDEQSLAMMDISDNIERTYVLLNEAQSEKEAYESMVASLEAESREQAAREEQAKREAEERARQEAEQANARREQQSQANAYLQSQYDYDAAHAAERNQKLASLQAQAASYDLSTLRQLTYTNSAGVTTDNCRVTFYCHCTKCCKAWGVNDVNYTAHANGMVLEENYSVAVDRNIIPIGTKLLAVVTDGTREYSRQIFKACDTGVGGLSIDIYRKTHTYAQKGYTLGALPGGMYAGCYYVKLYVIP